MGHKKGALRISENQLKGIAWEYMYTGLAMRHNFIVEIPTCPCPWDCTVKSIDNPRKFWHVQVKGTEYMEVSKKKVFGNRYRITCKQGCANKFEKLDTTHVDILAAYCEDMNVWYNIPTSCVKKYAIQLYPHVKRSKGQYEIWKHNWDAYC